MNVSSSGTLPCSEDTLRGVLQIAVDVYRVLTDCACCTKLRLLLDENSTKTERLRAVPVVPQRSGRAETRTQQSGARAHALPTLPLSSSVFLVPDGVLCIHFLRYSHHSYKRLMSSISYPRNQSVRGIK